MNIKAHDGIADDAPFQAFLDPHHITESQLADLGLQEIAYVRPIMTPSGPAFGVFAANGVPMAVAADNNVARAAIVQHELAPVSVH
ncbi:unnamed protein product [Acidocella sp. C78]|uniref:DUF1150 family protein n=1 Tax=Acidocella sp. C78 TaxID=1671486 RepID=UPI00191BACB4|nr:DUF1150 family protein [Acidocella sp. C78]CAG4917544.1 unnamed protein product [Acidocella sp. C78]CAG4930038.1 unnamed protein product [Acidocella sp. C78]